MPGWLTRIWAIVGCGVAILAVAGGCGGTRDRVLTLSGSLLGREGEVLRRQLDRFRTAHPDDRGRAARHARRRRPAPSALRPVAQRARRRARRPAARRGLDGGVRGRRMDCRRSIASTRRSTTSSPPPWRPTAGAARSTPCRGSSTSACSTGAPTSCRRRRTRSASSLARLGGAPRRHGLPFGLVWQGARYEGLVTVFVEYLGAFGGAILDGDGRVVVDAEAGRRGADVHARRDPATASCRPRCWPGRRSRRGSRSRTARRRSCATGRMRTRCCVDDSESAVAGRFAVAPMPGRAGRRADRGARGLAAGDQRAQRSARRRLSPDRRSCCSPSRCSSARGSPAVPAAAGAVRRRRRSPAALPIPAAEAPAHHRARPCRGR